MSPGGKARVARDGQAIRLAVMLQNIIQYHHEKNHDQRDFMLGELFEELLGIGDGLIAFDNDSLQSYYAEVKK